MKSFIVAAVLALAPLAVVAAEQESVTAQSSLPWVQAEVKKVDLAGGRLTLRHGDIPNLDMPGMTMPFRVSDPKMLATVKVGDAVRVSIDKVKGQLTIVRIEAVK